MVCLGNICRSPIAEGVMKKKLLDLNIDGIVDSAGTGSWHVGEKPDYRAFKTAQKNGVDISSQRARQITKKDFKKFDLIYVMDREVYDHVTRLAGINSVESRKVDFLMNVLEPESDRPVPDPYYGGDNGFDIVYEMIHEACEKIAENILKAQKESSRQN